MAYDENGNWVEDGTGGVQPPLGGPGEINAGYNGTGWSNVSNKITGINDGTGTQPNTTNEFVFPTGEEVKPYSGLPESYRDQLLGFMMPQLQSGVQ